MCHTWQWICFVCPPTSTSQFASVCFIEWQHNLVRYHMCYEIIASYIRIVEDSAELYFHLKQPLTHVSHMTLDMFRLSFPYSWLIIGIRVTSRVVEQEKGQEEIHQTMDKCLIAITPGFVNLWLANDMSIKKTYYGHCLRLPRGTSHAFQEKIEYTKIRSPKSKDRQQNAQKKAGGNSNETFIHSLVNFFLSLQVYVAISKSNVACAIVCCLLMFFCVVLF
jgi:hypothetical protein